MSDALCKSLLKSPHVQLCTKDANITHVVSGQYEYYHYGCDGVDDIGWGCGYRTFQSMCSWTCSNKKSLGKTSSVPSIIEIQRALIKMEDKTSSFLNSKDWIGTFEIALCMDYFYDIPCKIKHFRAGEDFTNVIAVLREHFTKFGSPVMMGGDRDAASKCILGVSESDTEQCILILDPHCSAKHPTIEELIEDKWLYWKNVDNFDKDSFYNLCLPQFKCDIG